MTYTVGKTSFIKKYLTGTFTDQVASTIGASFSTVSRTGGDKDTKLHINDPAGQERYRAIINIYYRNTDVVVLVGDLSNKTSIENTCVWLKDFQEKTDNPETKIILLGNKSDLYDASSDNNESLHMLEAIGKVHNCPVFIASAKNGEGINELFEYIFKELNTVVPFNIKEKLALESSNSTVHRWCLLL